jgi:hypothetical protein
MPWVRELIISVFISVSLARRFVGAGVETIAQDPV